MNTSKLYTYVMNGHITKATHIAEAYMYFKNAKHICNIFEYDECGEKLTLLNIYEPPTYVDGAYVFNISK